MQRRQPEEGAVGAGTGPGHPPAMAGAAATAVAGHPLGAVGQEATAAAPLDQPAEVHHLGGAQHALSADHLPRMSMVHHVAALQEVFQGHLCEIEVDLVRPAANLSLRVTN